MPNVIRYALLTPQGPDTLRTVRRYLPSNYQADPWQRAEGQAILIHGHDEQGWTLDGYVLPRLASGLLFAREVDGSALVLPPVSD